MKKLTLFIFILPALITCNGPQKHADTIALPTADTPLPKTDSSPVIPDSARSDSVKPSPGSSSIGTGLTEEEMTDDTIFTDGSRPTSWEVAGITDVKGFKLFLKQVQSLVLNNDKEALARLIRYPLGRSIKTEKDFIKNYDRIFSKDARLSIARMNFSQIFRNSKGAMSEEGKVWFAQVGKEFRIIAVNN